MGGGEALRVLHVSLGWPPFRTGGLVRYCCDLIEAQVAAGYDVAMLYPAGSTLSYRARLRRRFIGEVVSYELYSRNMVPLVFGTRDPDALDQADDRGVYDKLLEDFKPDVIHIHSLQGIGQRFFEEVERRGIKTVYTTHDYYPICLRCNFINLAGELCGGPSAKRCWECNATGLSSRNAFLMQSSLYKFIKNSLFGQCMRNYAKNRLKTRPVSAVLPHAEDETVSKYGNVLRRHSLIMSKINIIHANSEQAKEYYSRAFPDTKIEVIPISHAGLSIHRTSRVNKHNMLKVGYVGGASEYKGYRVLFDALSQLSTSVEWELLFYGTPPSSSDAYPAIEGKIKYCGFYSQEEAANVLTMIDVLVVPSIWPETFGFVVLEALCEGTPVICSDKVGARYLVNEEAIYSATDPAELAKLLRDVALNKICFKSLPTEYPIEMSDQVALLEKVYSTL